MTSITEKQLRFIKIDSDLSKVKIGFNTLETVASGNGTEEEGESYGESKNLSHQFQITGRHRPHEDFVNSMKKLRKFALELADIDVNEKKIGTWTVSKIKIAGDVLMKQSRVEMTLAHTVERQGKSKIIEFPVGQIAMYPEKDEANRYYNSEKMTEVIEDVIEEAFSYLNGKYEEENSSQLALFPTESKLQTNFVQ